MRENAEPSFEKKRKYIPENGDVVSVANEKSPHFDKPGIVTLFNDGIRPGNKTAVRFGKRVEEVPPDDLKLIERRKSKPNNDLTN